MKKTLLALSVLIAFASASSAQFTFQTAEGKTIGSKVAPTYRTSFQKESGGPSIPIEDVYLTWEKERVKIVTVGLTSTGEGIRGITEFYFYYDLFDPKNVRTTKDVGGVNCNFNFPKPPKLIPYYNYDSSWTYGGMNQYFSLLLPTQQDADAFLEKLADKKLDLALDLEYIPGPRLAIADFRFPPRDAPPTPTTPIVTDEAPASAPAAPGTPAPPAAPKKIEEVLVILYNKSNSPIEVVVKNNPKGSTRSLFTVNARSTRREKIKVGGEVRAKGSDALLLTVTEKMDKTEQVIAR
jgi:hypothetical protein